MVINYQDITLRDMKESDIADHIRWRTVETAWKDWDGPWAPLSFDDPEGFRQKKLEQIRTFREGFRRRFEVDAAGVHIGTVINYPIDEDCNILENHDNATDPAQGRWTLGIDLYDSAYWSGGWGTKALTAWVRYHLDAECREVYLQTWSGNRRMAALAEKVGFREFRRKPGLRKVRGGAYDGLTFLLDRDAFAAHCRRMEHPSPLALYIPRLEDMWFAQRMQEDPETMAYNAGWDVSYGSYHPDTGCIDLPESAWAAKHQRLVGHEPEQFYAFLRVRETGDFAGYVNFRWDADEGRYDMSVVLYAPYRGRGWGSEALELLLRRAFLACGVPALHNTFETTRAPAIAIHKRAGFRQVGTTQDVRFGRPVELMELELTREAYLNRR